MHHASKVILLISSQKIFEKILSKRRYTLLVQEHISFALSIIIYPSSDYFVNFPGTVGPGFDFQPESIKDFIK